MKTFKGISEISFKFLLVAGVLSALSPLAYAADHGRAPTNQVSCKTAYKTAMSSISIGDVTLALDVCSKAKEVACVAYVNANSDGPETGDGAYISALCELKAAYGANKAVQNGRASKTCAAALKGATNSPSISDVSIATAACVWDTGASCMEKIEKYSDGIQTGDGRLISAGCQLTAAHGAYLEVTKTKRSSK